MKKYIIHYFYATTGEYSNHDIAIVEAESEEEVKEKYSAHRVETDEYDYWRDELVAGRDPWDDTIFKIFEEADRPKGLTKTTYELDEYNPVKL